MIKLLPAGGARLSHLLSDISLITGKVAKQTAHRRLETLSTLVSLSQSHVIDVSAIYEKYEKSQSVVFPPFCTWMQWNETIRIE